MENKLSVNESIAIIILLFVLTLFSIGIVYIAMSIGLSNFNIMNWNLWGRLAFLFISFAEFCIWLKIMKEVYKDRIHNGK